MRLTLHQQRARRSRRARMGLTGSAKRPRLTVFRSNKHISAQLIDDTKGETLVSASDTRLKIKGTKAQKAIEVGRLLATKAAKKEIRAAVFDRGHYKFHGRIAALAKGAREKGLQV